MSLETARQWQMDGLDEVYEDAWGPHLVQVREQLHHESLQFMKEQRIRCLLQGDWFPTAAGMSGINPNRDSMASWRFVRLSHNRRWLHYRDYSAKGSDEPPLEDLPEKLDLTAVTSVDSNVSASDPVLLGSERASTASSTSTLRNGSLPLHQSTQLQTTKITILGTLTSSSNTSPPQPETPLLDLYPQSPHLAAEWLDGLLLLLDQHPITKSTTSLIDMMADWGVRLRMLNLRWEDVDWEDLETRVKGGKGEEREVPDREGLDDDFWYAMGET